MHFCAEQTTVSDVGGLDVSSNLKNAHIPVTFVKLRYLSFWEDKMGTEMSVSSFEQ